MTGISSKLPRVVGANMFAEVFAIALCAALGAAKDLRELLSSKDDFNLNLHLFKQLKGSPNAVAQIQISTDV